MLRRAICLLWIGLLNLPLAAQGLSVDDSMAGPGVKDAFKHFQPGPRLKRELDSLDQSARDLLALYRDGKVDERTLVREKARRDLAAFVLKAWAFSLKRDEVATVAVVLVGSDEFYRVFPRGTAHLPKQLQPNQTVESAPGSDRKWQYVGQREASGFKFAIFRLVE